MLVASAISLKPGERLTIASQCKKALRHSKAVGTALLELLKALKEADVEVYHQARRGEHEPFLSEVLFTSGRKKSLLVSEVFTRSAGISKSAEDRGHHIGQNFSLELGDDLLNKKEQQETLEKIRKQKPFCVVPAFPCEHWSSLQNLSQRRRCPRKWQAKEREAWRAKAECEPGSCVPRKSASLQSGCRSPLAELG